MIIIKHFIFAFTFFSVFNCFAQDQIDTSESIESEEINQKIIEQYSATDSVNAEIVQNTEQDRPNSTNEYIPPSIQYKPIINTTVGIVVLDVKPSNTGGEATLYTVSPDLPRGLFLNPANGVICGIPMEMKEDDIYTITAINKSGRSSYGTMLLVGPPIEEENTIFIQMKEYPDPVEDFLSIDGEKGIKRVEIYNIKRKLVYSDEYINFNPLSRKLLDLSKFETGEYILTLFKENELSSFTILKEEPSYTIFRNSGL